MIFFVDLRIGNVYTLCVLTFAKFRFPVAKTVLTIPFTKILTIGQWLTLKEYSDYNFYE